MAGTTAVGRHTRGRYACRRGSRYLVRDVGARDRCACWAVCGFAAVQVGMENNLGVLT